MTKMPLDNIHNNIDLNKIGHIHCNGSNIVLTQPDLTFYRFK